METQDVELEGDIISPTREVVSSYIDTDPPFVVASPEPHALTSEDMQEPGNNMDSHWHLRIFYYKHSYHACSISTCPPTVLNCLQQRPQTTEL